MFDNFGFIHTQLEIKLLILFVLRRLPEPISLEMLAEITMIDDGISYFDFAECVNDLVNNGHLFVRGEKYSLTNKGIRNIEATEINIPYSVRVKAEDKTSELRMAQNRSAMIKTSHETDSETGCKVKLSMSDGIGEIVSIELIAANEAQAIELEDGFRKNAEEIYNKLVEFILPNMD